MKLILNFRLLIGFHRPIPLCGPVKSSVAIETLESDQSHYMIFVFIGELTNWPNKMFPETGPKSFKC
jgi:hypothetical protein